MSYPVTNTDSSELTAISTVHFDVKKFVFRLISFLPWIILSALIAYGIAWAYLRYTPQMHRVSANLLIKDNDESSPDYNVLRELGVMPGSKEVQDQIDILQSYELSEGIVDSLNLQIKIFTEARIASSIIYGKNAPVFIRAVTDTAQFKPATYKLLLSDDFFTLISGENQTRNNYNDTVLLAGKKVIFNRNPQIKADVNGYNIVVTDKRAVATAIRKAITVTKLHDMGGIIEIAMLDEAPLRAIDIITKLIEAYNTAGITDKTIVGNKTSRFLTDRVDTVSRELDELELKAETFKRVNKINDIRSAGAQYLQQSLNYDNQQVMQQGQLKLLQSLQQFVEGSKTYTDIIPSQNGLQETTLEKLIAQYNEQVLSYQQQTKISTQKDPVVARLKNELTDLKGNILKNIESVRQGYQTNLTLLSSRYNGFENLLASMPEKEREFLKLKRQIGVKEQLYLYLLQKKEETELSLVSTINNTRVVDAAFDMGVVSPKGDQIILIALLLGIIFPIIIMLLIDFFNNKITDRKEIEAGTHIPIIGELSYNRNVKNKIVHAKSRSGLAEQFRLIGTNLQFIASDQQTKVILVTSFMSGEGKSFVSANLASSLSAGNVKVLLIEMDLRKPKLAKYLDVQATYGLTDYLVNGHPFEKIIARMPGTQLVDIITCGPVPPNPAELLMHERMNNLITYARENYKYIIIDSSPVGLVADVFLTSKFIDITLFILRHKYSLKTSVQYAEKLSTENKLNRINIIVNGIKGQQGVGYGYGYSYGYGYHYGSGYYPDDEQPGGFKKLFSRTKGK